MQNRLESMLSGPRSVENLRVIRPLVQDLLFSPAIQTAISAARAEVQIRDLPSTPDIEAQREQLNKQMANVDLIESSSLVTILKDENIFKIYYKHIICSDLPMIRGFLVSLKGTLSGVKILQMDDQQSRTIFAMYRNSQKHLANILVNLFLSTGTFSYTGRGLDYEGQLTEKLFVISDYTSYVDRIINLQNALFTPQNPRQVPPSQVNELQLPWTANFSLI
jgi:hypothetical protein